MSDKKSHQTFGQKLKAYRVDEMEWTLEQMADFIRVSRMTIYRLENDLVEPNDITLSRLKKRLPDLMTQKEQVAS